MATNIQGRCTKLEGILKSFSYAMDGNTPSSDTSQRDLLMNMAVSTTAGRREIINQGTLNGLSHLMSYRDDLLKSFVVKLGADEVFENVQLLVKFTELAFSEMKEFMTSTEKRLATQD